MSRILVIDDNSAVGQVLEYCLRQDGHAVTLAGDGETGLRLAAELPAEIVLLDVHMPGMDGFAVCDAIKGDPALRNVPVILMTACPSTALHVRAKNAGAAELLAKPFQPQALQAALDRAVQGKPTGSLGAG